MLTVYLYVKKITHITNKTHKFIKTVYVEAYIPRHICCELSTVRTYNTIQYNTIYNTYIVLESSGDPSSAATEIYIMNFFKHVCVNRKYQYIACHIIVQVSDAHLRIIKVLILILVVSHSKLISRLKPPH